MVITYIIDLMKKGCWISKLEEEQFLMEEFVKALMVVVTLVMVEVVKALLVVVAQVRVEGMLGVEKVVDHMITKEIGGSNR